jgi:NAD dependent epimerase/dehydratase family enzyme
MRTIVISGGTGLIGSYLSRTLQEAGYRIRVLTRFPEKYRSKENITYHFWDWKRRKIDENIFDEADAFIHLAGANIGQKRWTDTYKAEISGSRILSLQFIRQFLIERGLKLKNFIGASAIGFYGCKTDDIVRTEEDLPGDDF